MINPRFNRMRIALAALLLLLFGDAQSQLNFNPPRIIVSDRPQDLMLIDGPPVTVPIEGTGLEFVVNTDRDLFRDRESGNWYLLQGGYWQTNSLLAGGKWFSAADLPSDFLTLQVSSDWPQVAAAMPARVADAPLLPVIISYEPTELVLIDGDLQLEPIAGTGLQFVSNTASDLFLYENRYYLLLSGRWFSTKSFKRQWASVRSLPGDFAAIPGDHRMARVLPFVAGTPQAEKAVAEATEPRLAIVDAGAGDELEVPYMGAPSFVDIEGTVLRRAENTPFQVILHNNYYYLCYNGAWFSSTNPRGPWRTAKEIPEAIYTIPPTDPAYNVTFVRLSSFDDSSGQVAYQSTSGYYHRYSTGSTIVYGTGWYYPGYHNRSVYWRYPYTYGYGGAWGPYFPPGYGRSETFRINSAETDWVWDLDGTKRRVYTYGPANTIGSGAYKMPESDNYKGDGK